MFKQMDFKFKSNTLQGANIQLPSLFSNISNQYGLPFYRETNNKPINNPPDTLSHAQFNYKGEHLSQYISIFCIPV